MVFCVFRCLDNPQSLLSLNWGAIVAITPVFFREMMVAARGSRLQGGRTIITVLMLAIVLGTFAVRYSESVAGGVEYRLVGVVARQSFGFLAASHVVMGIAVASLASLSIAGEKDRRTLDFLLATRLTNAEMVLGKLAAVIMVALSTIAAGLPVLVLVALLGGIDLGLILLTYAGTATTTFFVACLSIWISTSAKDRRRATLGATAYIGAWFIVPTIVAVLLPRAGVSIPAWIVAPNTWLWTSCPFSLLLKLSAGGLPFVNVFDAVLSMAWRQVLTGTLFLLVAILRLRTAYRINTGGDDRGPGRAFRRISWRIRQRPDVGDDPIVWREMYTSRARGLARLTDSMAHLTVIGALVSATWVYAWPALVEVGRYGYRSGPFSDETPELNILVRFFLPGGSYRPPLDQARIYFNIFLRYMSVGIVFFAALIAPGFAAQAITSERAKETWTGILATPLTGREILRSLTLAALWRIRPTLLTLAALWTLGLLAGSIHPVGFIVVMFVMATSTWFLLAFGAFSATRAADGQPLLLVIVVLTLSAVLLFLIPANFRSVLLGCLSLPFDVSLSLVSYREVRVAQGAAVYPLLQWIGLSTGDGLLQVALTCLIGIVAPALGALFTWRLAVAQFDRLVGRPWQDHSLSRSA
jgi:ABC-type transport system involved in multi-copper enzyme maturation permease subunit